MTLPAEITVHRGDCRKVLPRFAENSVDACITDPPYGLGLMGLTWDRGTVTFDPNTWREVLRVVKPGGYLLAWGAPRTYHRMVTAVEDAGFDVVDCLGYLFSNGYPKSLNIADQMGRRTGVGPRVTPETLRRYQGHGTALKPAWELILVARKPFAGTYVDNLLRWGTGSLDVDACRIRPGESSSRPDGTAGRWPPNVLLEHAPGCRGVDRGDNDPTGAADGNPGGPGREGQVDVRNCVAGCPVSELDAQSGIRKAGGNLSGREPSPSFSGPMYGKMARGRPWQSYGDVGGASRFFPTFRYGGKAGQEERPVVLDGDGGDVEHPTVKSLAAMRWLVRLVVPAGGVVLDPFAGSGTTLEAALIENRRAVGVEVEGDFVRLIEARLTKPIQTVLV